MLVWPPTRGRKLSRRDDTTALVREPVIALLCDMRRKVKSCKGVTSNTNSGATRPAAGESLDGEEEREGPWRWLALGLAQGQHSTQSRMAGPVTGA